MKPAVPVTSTFTVCPFLCPYDAFRTRADATCIYHQRNLLGQGIMVDAIVSGRDNCHVVARRFNRLPLLALDPGELRMLTRRLHDRAVRVVVIHLGAELQELLPQFVGWALAVVVDVLFVGQADQQ